TTLGTLLLMVNAGAKTPAGRLWTDLQAKRTALSGAHQEFEVSQTFSTPFDSQSSRRPIVIDMAQGQWRESAVNGSGYQIRIFDGRDLLAVDEGGNEFVRTRHPKEEDMVPSPYGFRDQDWSKALEVGLLPCKIPG